MKITRVDVTDPKSRNAFIRLPFDLYKDCPQWVPPFIGDMHLVMDKQKHPFYRHSDAAFFIATSEKQVLGRIAVLFNRNYGEYHHTKTAFFYFFDTVDDIQVASGLFDHAITWSREKGLDMIYGPRGFIRSNCVGMLVRGFEFMPAMNMNYNFSYYQTLMEQMGFSKETDYLSGFATRENYKIPDKVLQMAEKIKSKGNFWVKTFDNRQEMLDMIPQVEILHEEAFKNNPAYYPSTKEEFDMLARGLLQIANPDLIKVIMHQDEIAGFLLAFPNINKAIQRCKGKVYPFGWIDLLWEKNRTDIIDLNGVGLMPKFQGMGANILLYAELAKTIIEHKNIMQAEFVQADERNFRSKSDSENMGVTWHKCHRTYEKHI